MLSRGDEHARRVAVDVLRIGDDRRRRRMAVMSPGLGDHLQGRNVVEVRFGREDNLVLKTVKVLHRLFGREGDISEVQ